MDKGFGSLFCASKIIELCFEGGAVSHSFDLLMFDHAQGKVNYYTHLTIFEIYENMLGQLAVLQQIWVGC